MKRRYLWYVCPTLAVLGVSTFFVVMVYREILIALGTVGLTLFLFLVLHSLRNMRVYHMWPFE